MYSLRDLLKEENPSLISPFLYWVKTTPDQMALWVEGKSYTYFELYQRAVMFANSLSQYSQPYCAILSDRSVLTYSAILGTLLAGKIFVPLSAQSAFSMNADFLKFIETDLIIADVSEKSVSDFLSVYGDSLNVISHHFPAACPRDPITKHSHAYLMFTSGSTGHPKAVLISHKNVLHYLASIIERCQPTAHDRFTQISDVTFDFSIHDMFTAWSVGASVFCIPRNHFIHLEKFINQHRISFWASVPSVANFLNQTRQLNEKALPSLRYSIFCGEPLTYFLASQWKRAAPNSVIDNLYGPTEASVACTGYRWDGSESSVLPLGFPFSHQEICIDNDELCLSGPQVFSGYFKNDALNQARFFYRDEKTWYRTGDLVEWNQEMGLIYKGRRDDQIKIRGHCTSRLEIEALLKRACQTDSLAVIFIKEENFIQSIVGFVCDVELDAKNIFKSARKILPHYIHLKDIIKLDFLPLNKNGKIDYKKLEIYDASFVLCDT